MILGVIAFFLSAAIEPLVPALFKQLLDSGFKADLGFPIWLVPVVIIGLFATRGLLAFCGTYLFNWSTSKAVLALRTDLIRSIMRADANIYTQMSPGVVATRVINDPQNATGALAGAVTTLLRDGTTLLALLGYLFYVNWKLTLISLVTMPILGVVVRKVQKRVLAIGGKGYESQIKLVGIVDDISRAWRVVRTFDAAEFEEKRFATEAQKLRRINLKTVAAGATMTPLTQIVASAGVALILTLALMQANQGQATVGEFVAFITALLMTISPMRHLTDVTQPIIGGLIGARACFDLMDTPPEPDTGTRVMDPAECKGDVRFDKVRVTYPGSEQNALNGLDLRHPRPQDGRPRRRLGLGEDPPSSARCSASSLPRRERSRSTGSTSRNCARPRCADSSPWSPRTSSCSTARSPTTWPTHSRATSSASRAA